MTQTKPQAPLTKTLLNILADMGESAIEFGHLVSALSSGYGSAYRRGGRGYVAELKRFSNERDTQRVLQHLQRTHYVTTKKIGQRLMVTLSKKGWVATLAAQLRTAPPHQANYFTMVIFDIPESQRAARLQLRSLLKRGGFRLLQHSVWISNRDAYRVATEFVRRLKLQRWVNVYHATDLLQQPNK